MEEKTTAEERAKDVEETKYQAFKNFYNKKELSRLKRKAIGLEKKWSQIAYFEGEDFDMLKKLCSNKKRSRLYPFEIFNMMIESGVAIKAIEPKRMTIKEIDSLKDL